MARHIPISMLSIVVFAAAIVAGGFMVAALQHEDASLKPSLSKQTLRTQQHIAIIGDSLTNQAGQGVMNIESQLNKAGYQASHWYIYGVDGKRIAKPDKYGVSTLENIAAARKKLGTVDVWLIALGTNDKYKPSEQVETDTRAVMEKIGTDTVVWVNATSSSQSYAGIGQANASIKKVLATYKNATYLDWDTYVHHTGEHSEWWKPRVNNEDPIHMTEAGYAVRNAYYVRQINHVVDAARLN